MKFISPFALLSARIANPSPVGQQAVDLFARMAAGEVEDSGCSLDALPDLPHHRLASSYVLPASKATAGNGALAAELAGGSVVGVLGATVCCCGGGEGATNKADPGEDYLQKKVQLTTVRINGRDTVTQVDVDPERNQQGHSFSNLYSKF